MRNKGLMMLLTGMILLLAGCGEHDIRNEQSLDSPVPTAFTQSPSSTEIFGTSVFLGDSITEGLRYHNILKEENVVANAGKTAEISFVENDVDKLIARNPQRVFINLGSTDILWPTENPKEHSLSHYAKLIDAIQEKLPKAKITLLSVTPVTAAAEKAEPRYRSIGEYNEGLQALAGQKQANYVDLTSFITAHADLYDTDGIHFQESFYPLLLDYLKVQLK
jgi:hypothetical protein